MSAVSFIELGSADASVTARFLSAMFDWTINPTGKPGEGWFETGTVQLGLHGGDPDRSYRVFFRVDDIEAARERVRALGGTPGEAGPFEPGFGRFCECTDPDGVPFGLHQIEN